MVGELAVLFRAPRAATVKARSDAVLLSVDRRSFEACGGRSEGSMARPQRREETKCEAKLIYDSYIGISYMSYI